jgi:hypothetical protein
MKIDVIEQIKYDLDFGKWVNKTMDLMGKPTVFRAREEAMRNLDVRSAEATGTLLGGDLSIKVTFDGRKIMGLRDPSVEPTHEEKRKKLIEAFDDCQKAFDHLHEMKSELDGARRRETAAQNAYNAAKKRWENVLEMTSLPK